LKLPLLLVKDDTFKAMERLEETPAFFSPKDKGKVRYFMRLMDQDDALEKLIPSLDLSIR
jgi:BioD-like phosphotransacetylase family protein